VHACRLLRTPGLAAAMVASVITVTAGDLIVIYLPLLGAERSIDVNAIGGLLTMRAAASMLARLIYVRQLSQNGSLRSRKAAVDSKRLCTPGAKARCTRVDDVARFAQGEQQWKAVNSPSPIRATLWARRVRW
jgi:hypothetical protein